jgi:hypothetical protein
MGYELKLFLTFKNRLRRVAGGKLDSQWRKFAHAPPALAAQPHFDRMLGTLGRE